MFEIFEVDHSERSWKIGEMEDLKEAKKIARKAFKDKHGEYNVFVRDEKSVLYNLR